MLVADDEPGMRDLFRYCFEPADYDIDTAVDGESAVDAVRRRAYDLVVLDVHMSPIAGTEALAEIWRLRPDQKVLILSSGGGERLDLERAAARQGVRWLRKPVELDELTGAIEALIAGSPRGAGVTGD
jgi:CheY-like chemotaxis protein